MSDLDVKHSQKAEKLKKEYDYEKLKESVLPETERSDLPLRIQSVSMFFKKFSDSAVLGGLGLAGLAVTTSNTDLLLLCKFTNLLAPLASVCFGGVGLIAGAVRNGDTAKDRHGDSEEVSGFREEFRKAAKGFFVKESISTACMATTPVLAVMTVVYFFGAAFGGHGEDTAFLCAFGSVLTGLIGGITGFKANSDSKKMEVYERAIKKDVQAQTGAAPKPAR